MSASESGPVETGFRYQTLPVGFLDVRALQRIVDITVFPTSVLAPYIWYERRARHSDELLDAIFWQVGFEGSSGADPVVDQSPSHEAINPNNHLEVEMERG